jgi:RNA polymerase sigma factor (sigma-70 family)
MSVTYTADVRQLVQENLKLAYKAACSFTRSARAVGLDDDDLKQEAVLGLMRAVAAFDPSLGFTLSALAYKCIKQHLIEVLRTRRYRRLLGLPRDAEGQELPVEDRRGEAPDDAAQEGDERTRVEQLLAVLHPRQRLVVTLYYLENLPLREVGIRAGISAERVRQTLVTALNRMRRHAGVDPAAVSVRLRIKEGRRRRGRRASGRRHRRLLCLLFPLSGRLGVVLQAREALGEVAGRIDAQADLHQLGAQSGGDNRAGAVEQGGGALQGGDGAGDGAAGGLDGESGEEGAVALTVARHWGDSGGGGGGKRVRQLLLALRRQ